jgi:hypothetical protein
MNPALLLALINEIALPELSAWLRARHAAGQSVTDADVIQKLVTDTNIGEQIGKDWLASHPVTPTP